MNLYLVLRERPLKPVVAPTVEAGTYVASIRAADSAGVTQEIPLVGQPIGTVLYIVSPACVWCERNVANVRALAAQSRKEFRFIGIAVKPFESGMEQNLGFPMFAGPSDETSRRLSLKGPTPTTIVVSPQGLVQKAWVGAYQAGLQREIETFFNVRLPGLSASGSDGIH